MPGIDLAPLAGAARIALGALVLGGCGGASCPAPVVPAPAPDETLVGWPGASDVIAASAEHRYAVLLQAREDTTGDGRVEVHCEHHHGACWGDRRDEWLVLGSGDGERIDELTDISGDGRYLAFVADGHAWVLDAATRERTDLGVAGAAWRGAPGPNVIGGDVRFGPGPAGGSASSRPSAPSRCGISRRASAGSTRCRAASSPAPGSRATTGW